MKGSTILVALLLALLVIAVRAAVEDDDFDDAQFSTDSISSHTLDGEPYTAPNVKDALFFENFNQDPFASGKWVPSKHSKYNGIWHWTTAPGTIKGIAEDKGLLATEDARHYAVASKIDPPLDNTNNDVVIQYEVKFDKNLECGGSYIKLLKGEDIDLENVNNESPYIIMFGPDYCGASANKVHFIFRHYNPVSKTWEEKHLKDAPRIKNDQLTHLYTLVIRKDNSFEVLIDNEVARKGSLLEDFDPPVVPPKEIDDVTDQKPSDWVDEEFIPDPSATKPDDWDENAPRMVDDPTDSKPEDWLDGEPENIRDPQASKPSEWDEEEDGRWEAPLIPNAKCQDHGCGTWKPRQIPNPEYKGVWVPPKIKNPEYKGVWQPRQVPNPNYFEDLQPSKLDKIGAVAIEIWTMQGGILFDNFLISHNVESAAEYAKKTWHVKLEREKESLPKPEKHAEGLFEQIKENVKNILAEYPIPAAVVATVVALLLSLPIFFLGRGGNARPQQTQPTTPVIEGEETKEEKQEEEKEEKKIKKKTQKT